jgi:hypothetical protein
LHEQQEESRKEELGAGATMEGEFGAFMEIFWSKRIKSQIVRPKY